MKRKILLILLFLSAAVAASAQQISPETLAKRNKRKNLTVKEINTDAKGKSEWLDHLTVYDDQGRKIEEIEYSTYGQVERVVTQYNDAGLVEVEIVYDGRNKPVRVRRYEYNENGTKKRQLNYMPSGKLYSIKEFQYTFSDAKPTTD